MKFHSYLKWVFVVSTGISPILAELPVSSPQNVYGFQSEQLFALRRSEPLPVVSATKRGVYVKTGNGPKRVSYKAVIGSKRNYFVASNLIEIRDQDFNFHILEDGRYQQAAISQMQRLEFNYDVEISELRQTSGSEAAERIAELENERSDYQTLTRESIEEGAPQMPGLHNALNLELEFQAEHDIEDAFCALIISYVTAKSFSESDKKTQKAIRAQYLGDIPGGRLHRSTLKFKLALGEYDLTDYQLYFYAGDGSPLPSNNSKMLKELTPEEILDIMGQ